MLHELNRCVQSTMCNLAFCPALLDLVHTSLLCSHDFLSPNDAVGWSTANITCLFLIFCSQDFKIILNRCYKRISDLTWSKHRSQPIYSKSECIYAGASMPLTLQLCTRTIIGKANHWNRGKFIDTKHVFCCANSKGTRACYWKARTIAETAEKFKYHLAATISKFKFSKLSSVWVRLP